MIYVWFFVFHSICFCAIIIYFVFCCCCCCYCILCVCFVGVCARASHCPCLLLHQPSHLHSALLIVSHFPGFTCLCDLCVRFCLCSLFCAAFCVLFFLFLSVSCFLLCLGLRLFFNIICCFLFSACVRSKLVLALVFCPCLLLHQPLHLHSALSIVSHLPLVLTLPLPTSTFTLVFTLDIQTCCRPLHLPLPLYRLSQWPSAFTFSLYLSVPRPSLDLGHHT